MLRIESSAPAYNIRSVDHTFNTLCLNDNWDILCEVVKMNGSEMIYGKESFSRESPLSNLQIRHDFWGSTSLAGLPTSLKALALAMIAKRDNKPFSCYEFAVGASIFPRFVELAEDTDLITLVAPRLRLSLVSRNMKKYKVLLDGKEGEIYC